MKQTWQYSLVLLMLPLAVHAEEANLEDVVVTATRTSMKTKDLPASLNVIRSKDLELDAGADNYYRALRNTPGILLSSGMSIDTVSLRGREPSMLANGRDANSYLTSTSMMNGSLGIGTGSIERIEVIKGPQAAIHGSRAMTGVVNVIRKRGDKDDPHLAIGGSWGQGNDWTGGVRAGGGNDDWAWFFDVSGRSREKQTNVKAVPKGELRNAGVYARIDRVISRNHKLAFEYNWSKAHSEAGALGTYYTHTGRNAMFGAEPENQGAFLSYEGKLLDQFEIFAEVGGLKNDYTGWNARPNTEPERFEQKEELYDYKERIVQAQVRGTWDPGYKGVKAIAGLQFKNNGIKTTGSKLVDGKRVPWDGKFWDESERYVSPYAQFEYRPLKQVLLLAGVRHDAYNAGGRKMNATSPNVGLSVFPFAGTNKDWTTLWASYSRAFHTPIAAQRYLPATLGGNPDLGPERSSNYEVGVKQALGRFGRVEASYFHYDFKDLIASVPIPDSKYRLLTNFEKARYKGFEIHGELTPVEWLSFHGGATFIDRKNLTTGKQMINQPNRTYQYGMTVKDLKGFNFTLTGVQYGDFQINVGKETRRHPSEGTPILDAKLTWSKHLGKKWIVEPFVAVRNLTNKTLWTPSYDPLLMEKRVFSAGLNARANF